MVYIRHGDASFTMPTSAAVAFLAAGVFLSMAVGTLLPPILSLTLNASDSLQ